MSIVRSALTSRVNWATVQPRTMGAGGEWKSGRADGQRWSDAVVSVHISALVCRRAGVYPGAQLRHWQIVTQSFVGNGAFHRSATAAHQIYPARRLGLCLLFTYCQYCRKLRDTLMINNCKYQFIGYRYIGNCVFWHLENISLFYDPRISRPPTFGARFCRKFCDLYASIYGTTFSFVVDIFQTEVGTVIGTVGIPQ